VARWLPFAAVAADGIPRVRTLVIRGWAVELCWQLLRWHRQFRLRGAVMLLPPDQDQN
jgi:hypothetical protein